MARTRFEPNEDMRKTVMNMALVRLPVEDIAEFMGCSVRQLN